MYNNRILKNTFDANELFGRFFVYESATNEIIPYSFITYGDLKAGTSFNYQDTGEGELILEFSNESIFFEISSLMFQKPICFEVFVNKNYEALEQGQFNLFYFANKPFYEEKPKEFEFTKQIQFISFTSLIEKNTIVEHNIEYDFNALPIDPDTGEKILPDDYNMIKLTGNENTAMEDTILQIYLKNIISTPVNRVKGDFHTTDATRIPKGFSDTIEFLPEISNTPAYLLIEKKQSAFDLRKKMNDFFKSEQIYFKYVHNLRYGILSKNLINYFEIKDKLTLTNGLVKDNYNYFKKEIEISPDLCDILVEGQGNTNKYSRDKINPKSFEWKSLEAISEGELDEDGGTINLSNLVKTIAGENELIDLTELEIYFNEKEYFKDLKVGQILELIGYSDLIDGEYIIKKMSCVLEDGYKTFSLDELERI